MNDDNIRKKTILVIEDDEDVLSMIVKHLKHVGYEVITAKDGMEGLKKIESDQYNLVITDIVMPFVSGAGIVSLLKEKKPHIPVIAITGYGQESEAVAIEKKADLVLAKPIKISILREYIAEFLKSKEE
ncbi:response regulator [Thermodesulfobacteriota bacterium]